MAKGIRINNRNLGVKRKSKSKHKKKNAAAALLKAKIAAGVEIVTKQPFLSKRQKRISKKIQQRKEKAKVGMEVESVANKKTKPDKKKRTTVEADVDEMVVE